VIRNGYVKREEKAVPWLRRGSRRPLIAEARVRSQGSSCGIRGKKKSGNGTGFSPTCSVSLVSINPILRTH